jgi:uncharacterized membrane protein HdeD (DUF308 family)
MEFITGALLIALGVAAIGLPLITSLSVSYLVACAFGAGGLVHLGWCDHEPQAQSQCAAGIRGPALSRDRRPHRAQSALERHDAGAGGERTLVAEGMVTLVAPFLLEDAPGSLWLLMSAIATIAAGFVAWSVSLIVPAVVVAALVGVALIANGTARIVTAFESSRVEV